MSDHALQPQGPDQPREHSFDGIEEYDNNLPLWWLMMLYISVAVAVIYVLHFHFGPGPLGAKTLPPPKVIDGNGYTEEQLRAFSKDPARGALGKALTSKALCVTCHGPELTGLVGPNLRDRWWIYGSNMTDIVLTISKGRLNGAMPAQEKNLSKDDIANLACYLVQLTRAEGFKDSPFKKPDPKREKETPIDY